MGNDIKQIYVAMELCENEIKLLVGEYFNTRFNIIRSDKYYTNSISDFGINNKEELSNDIRKALDETSQKILTDIEKVILVLPAYNFKRYPLKSKVVTENGIITKKDIARAVSNSLKTKVDSNVLVANSTIVKYNVNGISTRRLPENEKADEVYADIDLLCADVELSYDYVSAVENAGVKVLDITLNNYAIAREAALFEESLNKNVIILDINKTCTYLTLLAKGRLVSTEIVFDGLNSMINRLYRTYNMPYNDIAKLVKYSTDFNSEYPDDTIYAWTDQGATKSINTRMLNQCIDEPLDALCEKLVSMCKPIIEDGALIVLTGEGCQMASLLERLKEKTLTKVKTYYPDTIGVRDPAMTALYGAFFVYRDKVLLNDLNVNCVDLIKYENAIDQKKFESEGETITTKIKNLFKQYMEKGEK
ncbi:MAG: hypothetical protein IKF80_07130 [Erysipelotrichaceae bacterium]|nr:hypothetical protein [Erysipelotrichaceae bacterium]